MFRPFSGLNSHSLLSIRAAESVFELRRVALNDAGRIQRIVFV